MIDLRPQAVNRNIKGQVIRRWTVQSGFPFTYTGHFPIGCIRDHPEPKSGEAAGVTIRQADLARDMRRFLIGSKGRLLVNDVHRQITRIIYRLWQRRGYLTFNLITALKAVREKSG